MIEIFVQNFFIQWDSKNKTGKTRAHFVILESIRLDAGFNGLFAVSKYSLSFKKKICKTSSFEFRVPSSEYQFPSDVIHYILQSSEMF